MGGMEKSEKEALWKSLRRIEGQVGGIRKMVEEGKECGLVLTQITAAMSALKSVGRALLADSATKCNREDYAKLLKRFL
jgi:DNA-binding FrmR family transcriptional regulator